MRKYILAGTCSIGLLASGCIMDGRNADAGSGALKQGPSNAQIKAAVESASINSMWITCQELPSGEKEAYSLGVLNKKLEFLPAVASELGTQSVSTCEEARLFMKLVQEDPSNEIIYKEDAEAILHAKDVSEPAPWGQDATTVLSKATVAGATVANRSGVVKITIENSAVCTASMINSRALVTAAHCVDGFINNGHIGTMTISVEYFDPGLSAGSTRSVSNGTMTVSMAPTYAGSGDTQSDIAVITSSTPWLGTTNADYLGMYTDTMADARYNNIWGAGYDTDSHNDGKLRYDRIYIDWYGAHHFTDEQYNYRMCNGDSGGPLIRDDGSDIAITGLNSSSVGYGACGDQGGIARYNRMSSKVTWIEDVLQLAGIVGNCSYAEIPEGSYRDYMKCF